MIRLLTCCAMMSLLCSCVLQHDKTYPPRAVVTTSNQMYTLPWTFEGDDGERFISDVWDIRTTLQYQHILDVIPSFYEALIRRYTTVFGDLPYPKRKMDVFLFATEQQWKSQLVQILGSSEASHWFQLQAGGVTIDGTAVLYYLDKRGRSRVTFRIAAHEGWHQYAETAFSGCLPTWLDEGIGTWMEGFRIRRGEIHFLPASNWDRLTTLRTILKANRLSPLQELIQSDPSELLATGRTSLLGYYSQLWGLVSFIIEYEDGKYMPALKHVLKMAANGTIHEPIRGWLFCFSDDPIQFETEYKDWIVEYVRPSGQWR